MFGYVISAMAHWTTRDHDSSCLRGIRSTGHVGMVDNRTGIRMCNGPTPCNVWTTTCVDALRKACDEFAWRVAEWGMEWRPSCPVWRATSFESWFPWWWIQVKEVRHVSRFCAHRECFSGTCWFVHVEPAQCEPWFCEECESRASEPRWALHACCADYDFQPPFSQWRHTHWIEFQWQPCGCESTWSTWTL